MRRPEGFFSGAGSLTLDQKKSRAIRHWLELTGEDAWRLVAETQHDIPFSLGAYGESFAGLAAMFLNSKVTLTALDSDWQPMAGEGWISIDWSLPLDSKSQFLLFHRVLADFQKATGLLETKDKKRYRKKEDELLQLRNKFALWGQLRDHIASVSGAQSLADREKKLVTTDFLDEDLDELMSRRPRSFALSMLASERLVAQAQLKRAEEEACAEVETQRVQVRQAKWSFFVKALAQDHLAMKQLEAAPAKIKMLQHKKDVAWRQEQAEVGQRAVSAYMERYMRVLSVDSSDVIKPHVMDFLTYVARGCGNNQYFYILLPILL